jgi:glycosyltransferase involved in cell wall biosynthesis
MSKNEDKPSGKTKIAFIYDQCGPFYIGGYETRLWDLAKRLTSSFEITIFTSCDQDIEIDHVKFRKVRSKVNYFPERKRGFRDLRANAVFTICLLKLFFRKEKFAIVEANSIPWLHLPVSWLLARKWRARYLISVHEAFSKAMPTYFERKNGLLGKTIALFAMLFYRVSQGLADELVAASPSCVESLRLEGFKQPISVLSSGEDVIDVNEIDSMETAAKLVFTGRIVQMKRLDVLLDAAEILGNPIVSIIGDGPLLEILRERAHSLGLTKTRFYGRVSEEEKRRILRESTIFIMPSYREGWSLATLEAMANGCVPIYAYKPERYETGIRTYTEDRVNAFAFNGEASDLATKIKLAESDLVAYRVNAVKAANKFSWPAAIEKAAAVYDAR